MCGEVRSLHADRELLKVIYLRVQEILLEADILLEEANRVEKRIGGKHKKAPASQGDGGSSYGPSS